MGTSGNNGLVHSVTGKERIQSKSTCDILYYYQEGNHTTSTKPILPELYSHIAVWERDPNR